MKECPKCEICYGDEVQFCPQDQSQTRHTLPGTQLLADRYFIEKRLGRGAMGQVYLAQRRKSRDAARRGENRPAGFIKQRGFAGRRGDCAF